MTAMKRRHGRQHGYREWATFLRIPDPNTTDTVSALDSGWCGAAGVYPGADIVLRLLRDKVCPLVRYYEQRGLVGYHFLVHDRNSGVRTTDNGPFIHLRLRFKKAVMLDRNIWEVFRMTHAIIDDKQTSIAGIDLSILPGGVIAANRMIELQSKWVLSLVEAHKWSDDLLMVRQVRQFLHYFANMTQMKLIG